MGSLLSTPQAIQAMMGMKKIIISQLEEAGR